MDMRKLVGANVSRIRAQKGLTQEQLADLSGFSQQYISGLERGLRNPTVVTVYELAKALRGRAPKSSYGSRRPATNARQGFGAASSDFPPPELSL